MRERVVTPGMSVLPRPVVSLGEFSLREVGCGVRASLVGDGSAGDCGVGVGSAVGAALGVGSLVAGIGSLGTDVGGMTSTAGGADE